MGDIKTEYSTYFLIGLLIVLLSAIGLMVAWVILDKKGYLIRKKNIFNSIKNLKEDTFKIRIYWPLQKLKESDGFLSKRGKLIWAEAVRLANDTMDQIYIPKLESITDVEILQQFLDDIYIENLKKLNELYKVEKGPEETVEVFPQWIKATQKKFQELALTSKNAKIISECLYVLPKNSGEYEQVRMYCENILQSELLLLFKEKSLDIERFCEVAQSAKSDTFIKYLNDHFIREMMRVTDYLKNKEALYFLEEAIKKIAKTSVLKPALRQIRGVREEIIVDLYEPTATAKLEELAACLKDLTSPRAIFAFFDKVEALIPGIKFQLFSKLYVKQ